MGCCIGEQPVFGGVVDVLLLANDNCQWPPSYEGGSLLGSWGEIEFCRAFYPGGCKAVVELWVFQPEWSGNPLFDESFSADCRFLRKDWWPDALCEVVEICFVAEGEGAAQPRKLRIL